MSDIRVTVQWMNPTVFAGEDIECTITFKNIALSRSVRRSQPPSPHTASHGPDCERWEESLPMRSTNAFASAKQRELPSLPGCPQSHARTHKQALSISSPNGFAKSPVAEVQDDLTKVASPGANKHRRSISIISIHGEPNNETSRHSQLLNSGPSGHSHTRAASLQVVPRRNALLSNGSSPGTFHSAYFTTC